MTSWIKHILHFKDMQARNIDVPHNFGLLNAVTLLHQRAGFQSMKNRPPSTLLPQGTWDWIYNPLNVKASPWPLSCDSPQIRRSSFSTALPRHSAKLWEIVHYVGLPNQMGSRCSSKTRSRFQNTSDRWCSWKIAPALPKMRSYIFIENENSMSRQMGTSFPSLVRFHLCFKEKKINKWVTRMPGLKKLSLLFVEQGWIL